MNIYGLFSKKQNCLMGVNIISNDDADFCNSYGVDLDNFRPKHGDILWTTIDQEQANRICEKKYKMPDWYNSSFSHPAWSKEYFGDLEVVCLNGMMII